MPNIPNNFDGAKFALKYNLRERGDFHDDGHGYLICPTLPNLTNDDLLDCIIDPPPTEQIFALPIRTPAVYAEDIFVSSRKINDDADEALDEAILESGKAHGEPKSLDLIARSTVKKVSELKQKIVDLEDKIDKLDKRLKKLGN